MPHFVVEYSENLSRHVDMDEVLDCVHEAASSAPIFKQAAVRVRAYPSKQYRVADLHKDNAFLHVRAHVGSGRTEEMRHQVGKDIFDRLVDKLKPLFDKITLGISLELVEIDPVSSFRIGNLHENVAARQKKSEPEAT